MRKIFLSVGSASTEVQRDFVEAFKSVMIAHKLEPLTADAGSMRPFDNINTTMQKADGVIVIALERYFIPQMVERRGGTLKDEKVYTDVVLPTTWNQVETAFAHAWKLPLLVICEETLKEDGLLDRGNDWYVHRVKLDQTGRDYLRIQVARFSEEVHRRKRPLWHIWRTLDAVGKIGLVGTVLGIASVIATLIYSLFTHIPGA